MSAVERTLDVLFVVVSSQHSLTASEIAAALDVPLSTVYRHISVLKKYELVVDLGRGAGFAPGVGCRRIGRSLDEERILLPLALPIMNALAEETNESVGLMQIVGSDVFCSEMIDSQRPLRCTFIKGSAQPLKNGASAKSLLAFMTETKRNFVMKNSFSKPEGERLLKEIASIRSQGYAESENEVDVGVWGVSAPVFSERDQLECTLSLMAPTIRVGEHRQSFITATVTAAQSITNLLNSTNYKLKGIQT